METYFEIIDDEGVVESPIDTLDLAYEKLNELYEDGFHYNGDVKIVEVHHTE